MIIRPLIFIHVPKTGGASITEYFRSEREHYPVTYYKANYPEKFKEYLVFACTRNPWARMVSAYFYQKIAGSTQESKEWFNYRNQTFDSYIINEYEKFKKNESNIKPVMNWICDKDNKIIVDYICNLHTIKKDFDFIRKIVHRKDELIHINKSKHGDYKEYYKNKNTYDIVCDMFKSDIDFFKFNFENKDYSDFSRIINYEKFKKLLNKK